MCEGKDPISVICVGREYGRCSGTPPWTTGVWFKPVGPSGRSRFLRKPRAGPREYIQGEEGAGCRGRLCRRGPCPGSEDILVGKGTGKPAPAGLPCGHRFPLEPQCWGTRSPHSIPHLLRPLVPRPCRRGRGHAELRHHWQHRITFRRGDDCVAPGAALLSGLRADWTQSHPQSWQQHPAPRGYRC